MPGKLMRYSGLITKARAMSKNLLTSEQLEQLTELATVNEAIQYLKGTKGYECIYRDKEGVWHRGQAEAVIAQSLYQDFEKLYRFSDLGQRPAFQYVLFRYEVDILKLHIKQLFQKKRETIHLDAFFYKHVDFPLEKVQKAASLQELEQCLNNTAYEKIFTQMHNAERKNYVDYAMRLDIFYYTTIFRMIKRMKDCDLKHVLLEIYGTQIDWLNIMWIYRSRRFYNQTQAEIFAWMIPGAYRIKKEELKRMAEAPDLSEMNRILENSAYFRGKDAFVQMEDEISYRKIMAAVYQRVSRKYPVSMAPVLKYIYQKEIEIRRLTNIIEGIRYQVPPSDIKDFILITV